jgi:DNA-binding transcriptional MerR regulator
VSEHAIVAPPLRPVAEWTVDELARHSGLPVRTIREYQTLGLVPPPRRQGRTGRYGPAHLARLQLIGRLQRRGHSLAGIGDLLAQWRDGGDLPQILALDPDQLVHVDEPGAPATIEQLGALVPALVPDRLEELVATGVVEACGPDRFCVPSPSLLQLLMDALSVGLSADDVLDLLHAIRSAADGAATAALRGIEAIPVDADPEAVEAFLHRARGLLGHGVGRLALHAIGRRLGVTDERDLDAALGQVAKER